MQEFVYRANNRRGKPVEGTCWAKSHEQADQDLRAMGYEVLEIREFNPAEPSAPAAPPARIPAGVRMLTTGLWLLLLAGSGWALHDLLVRPSRPRTQATLPRLQRDIASPVGLKLAGDARVELAFPEIPLVVEKTAQELIFQGQLRYRLDIASSRKVSYCILRCRSPRTEQRISL